MGILELVMIVKNSGQVLQTVLENIKPHIDYWSILDTGSVDGTQDLIMKTMEGKEGKLFQESFTNFRDTRNRSLDLSSGKCKYQIILDDTYIVNNGEKLRDFLLKNNKNCYHINIIDNYKNTSYYSNRIIKTSAKKRYEKYKIHEAIPDEEMNLLPNTINIVDFRNFYHVERTQKRLEYDLKILYEHFNTDQKDSRIIYYLAVTYQSLKKRKEAIKWFKKLVSLGKNVRPNELFEARYQIIEYNDDVLKLDWATTEEHLIQLIKDFPYRIEPVYKLFRHEYENNNNQKAYKYICLCKKMKEPINFPYEYDFRLYRTYTPYFFIDLSLKLGFINEGVECLKESLQRDPTNQHFLSIKNFITTPNIHPIKLSDNRTIVIHTGKKLFEKPWNKNNIISMGSGSEIMAINIAEILAKKGYRVILFGFFKDGEENFEGVFNGVEYIDYTYYREFYEKYEIDILIVSRYTENLVYNHNVKKAYVWVHDVYPLDTEYIFQTHPEKFKGFLCVSNWQRKLNQKEFKFSPSYFIQTYNAIHLNRFQNKKIPRIPRKFIWTSSITRGLEYGIDMMTGIIQKYEDAKLHVFGNRANLTEEQIILLKDKPYIIFRDRVSQEELSNELLSSDVWLYPNHFEETYCISAVEAQAAGCLVCCNVHAGLEDTVGDRGAVIKGKYDKKKLLEILFAVMENDTWRGHLLEKGRNFAKTQNFESLADDWINTIF